MRATDFEFKYRFWIITAIFFGAFWFDRVDHVGISDWLAHHMMGLPMNVDSPAVGRGVRIVFWTAVLIAGVASMIRTWAGAYLHSSVVHDVEFHSDRLVADGPYRHMRNPLYLGTVLLAVAIGLLASRVGFLFLVAGMMVFTLRLILREERNLSASQGESYQEFLRRVPRLVPSLRARVPPGGAKPNWADGFTGETFMWGCTAALAALAITLRSRPFWIVLCAGFAIYFAQTFYRKRHPAE
jgi:protein-S-isoprenylcysteine O-methyltransferase Ste14